MMTVKLTIAYDGTSYVGWQRQKNGVSVQELVEKAVFEITGENSNVTASGRTDAGVHANGQVAHFKTRSSVPAERFSYALNTRLPADIRVLKSERAENDFNARFSAKKKTYRYSFYVSEIQNPLKERYALQIYPMPSVEAMKEAAELFVGEHDFKSYSSTGSSVKSTIRTIYSINLIERENEIDIEMTGNGFLYNMVRIISGAILAYGYKKVLLTDLSAGFCGKRRPNAVKNLAAKGLTLVSVDYE